MALLGLFLAAVGGLGWRSRGWPLVHDAPIMHYVAWRIGEGDAPYRDLFDMNFPGTYLVHLAVLRTLGPGDGAWRVLDLSWLVAGSLAVAAFAAPWGLVASAGGALFFALHHLAAGPWQTGQRDFLLCPLLLLGALGVARWMEARVEPRPDAARWPGLDLLWGGLALGAGITIKPHAAIFALALGLLVIADAWRTSAWTPAVAFGAGALLPPLAAVGWVAMLGGLPAWRAILLEYLVPLYSRLGQPPRWGFDGWPDWLPVAAALLLSLGSAPARHRFGPRRAIAALGLAYGLLHYFGQGKGWEYHVYPLAAFAAVVLFSEIEALLRARRMMALPLALCLVLTVLLFWGKGRAAAQAAEGGWISAKAQRVTALVDDLRPRLRPGDLVQVLDTTEGGAHALLRLGARQPTRFLYDFHFFHDVESATIRALRAEFMTGLTARPPRFIVVFEQGWPGGGYERLNTFTELATLLATAYRVQGRGDGYLVYAKRDDP